MSLGDKQNKKVKQDLPCDNVVSSAEDNGFGAGVDRKLLVNCVLSIAVAMVVTFATMKIGMSYHDDKIQELFEHCSTLENEIKAISESVVTISTDLSAIQTEMKADKETAARVYSSVSSLQREIESIKKELHIEQVQLPENVDTEKNEQHVLSPKEKEFIESLEHMIESGVPFADYVQSKALEIDLTSYSSYKSLMEFAKENVKSGADLMKECAAVGETVFAMNVNESFWEKHKRIIKEKIVGAIKLGHENTGTDDKTIFKNACQQLADGDIAGALVLLQQIKTEHEALHLLITDMKKRSDLNESFSMLKDEFLKQHGSSNRDE
jgi:hypothetical protein